MKKEIKDFLHLYRGCQIEYEHSFSTKEGSELRKAKLNYVGTNSITHFCDLRPIDRNGLESLTTTFRLNINDIKPILRPLSDMTEEEITEAGELPKVKKYDDGETEILNYALMTTFLLSKHFDLFQLIESGLAIDKTQTNKL